MGTSGVGVSEIEQRFGNSLPSYLVMSRGREGGLDGEREGFSELQEAIALLSEADANAKVRIGRPSSGRPPTSHTIADLGIPLATVALCVLRLIPIRSCAKLG